ncbi:MAG: LmbE family N-acetylglucosaminyl deacetylase [Limisphaerales bacterium]|jgi:LmbE family N-acetylglucosaminyl deacetylase
MANAAFANAFKQFFNRFFIMVRFALLVLLFSFGPSFMQPVFAQQTGLPNSAKLTYKPAQQNSAEILESIRKLSVLGSAMYIAAHPDDENTRLIAWLANDRKVNTTYLSLTRGDGGQNLIGPEIREMLGVLRTEELNKARSIDGGNQFFSRANDFGYSKHPKETFAIWESDEVLADVVWAIRRLRPDVIINRFDHRSPGTTHGHHTASAMLSLQAAELASDATAFPEQLEYVDTWAPRRIFFNTSWWFYGSKEKFEVADKSGMVKIDAGVYYSDKGKSNTEIAAESRSMHKCQGFGSTGTRGEQFEYMEWLEGLPLAKNSNTTDNKPGDDPFEGMDLSWSRVQGGTKVAKLLFKTESEFNTDFPAESVGNLVAVLKAIEALPSGHWKYEKRAECEAILAQCISLYAEVISDNAEKVPGDSMSLKLEVISRAYPITLIGWQISPALYKWEGNITLSANQKETQAASVKISESMDYTGPYWLRDQGSLGLFKVEKQAIRGLPNTPRTIQAKFDLLIDGQPLRITRDVVFKSNDPVRGEVYRPLEVVPPASVRFTRPVYLFVTEEAEEIEITVRAHQDNVKGEVRLNLPSAWKSASVAGPIAKFELKNKGAEQVIKIRVIPPEKGGSDVISASVTVDGKTYPYAVQYVEYDHIAPQTVLIQAKAKVTRLALETTAKKIGYIDGAGDNIPAALIQIGCTVDMLEEADFTLENLNKYDAILVGIRAYNTRDRLKFHQETLMEYVNQGGTMVVQYNTSHRLKIDALGPYPLKLSRERVTDEFAEVRILAPKHPAMQSPNKITSKDFDGWVQERGLYFPNEWDENYTALLSANDKDEPGREGGLLVAQYGEGWYVYTGYSFFRELPAGVPGAFRLFANLISLGNK